MLGVLKGIVAVIADLFRLARMFLRAADVIRAENLVLRRQLAGYLERGVKPRRMDHATRVNIEHCPHCAGTLKILAAIEDPTVIVAILTHLSLPARAPPRVPARALPLFQAA